ncbi:class I SAM-dependent methyltransferase [Actinoplanes sp. NPDC026623]|uniref:class I SAM-dependent methyltransferase n=1 Tax=Actinoplanes sp. NPDC026623 TaxID=3155610 RepID=UPI0033DD998F
MPMFHYRGHFGRRRAASHDAGRDPAPAVDFLAGLADGGPVLELAIGTGRVALPLAARGLAVEGVEGSPELVQRLRARPGGADLPVVVGDLADVAVRGRFRLVYLIFDTLFNLVDADRQADCLRNVARVLTPGGAFVVEAFVPDLARFEREERQARMPSVTEDSAAPRLHRYDRAAQTFIRQTLTYSAGGVRLWPFGMHYLWPGQIDRLAERAGLRLEARYAGWRGEVFDAASTDHVSVYRKPGGGSPGREAPGSRVP